MSEIEKKEQFEAAYKESQKLPRKERKAYMRKAMEDVFRLADEKRLPVVLETDETLKADKYRHLGMEQEGIRHLTPEIAFYEMIYRPGSIL